MNLIDTIEVEAPSAPVEAKTIKRKSPRRRKNNKKNDPDPFKYFVCLDFEATCWEKADQAKWKTQEIIEFPAVLLNAETGIVEAEFQEYLKPIEFNTLSDFCVRLTGITQDVVNKGISIHECIYKFDKWIMDVIKKQNLEFPKTREKSEGNIALCTWTNWDGTCLAKECARKKIRKPTYFCQWIDVRAIFIRFYKHHPKSFGTALEHAGLTFIGKPHSGIDDARNLSRLIQKMKQDGATFHITKDTAQYQAVNKPVVSPKKTKA